ncbi:5-(carboxyamino)imidazole ribonucleotide mutase [Endozoicomonas sp. SM1973]|uniref:N5-carboxyaminoimidazole ribonucleotide mutase n=1 Tax=Spartinivicinus marinus TaxID=2994442 RepID=A0A853I573_9GAMM|nr:5-(carboxyamino)imidazole ribonucleotide mutase [Spartinivicinus marinus]MCX4026923.1 5-(carboxyamino)imidazole ribonucleotide mutase [Spartinivicinus marinus]NYZ66732.1 5-(carboxyamino)imidazole ribonucleotide mutase [Spartinivicinus marinus]
MAKPFVAILMGSDSDFPKVEAAIGVLKKLSIPYEVRVHSAHRTPDATHQYVTGADQRGCAAFIACAGMAAHLAGVVASLTIKPVIGVPIDAGPLDGLDALMSTVQMPGGIPVATVAIGKAGAKNAGYLAAQIIAVSDADLAERLKADRAENAKEVLAKNEALQKQLNG